MDIATLDTADYSPAFGILCAPATRRNLRDGLYPTFARVAPGGSTTPHAHFEPELFYIIQGTGRLKTGQANDVSRDVTAGDLVRIAPFERHALTNAGPNELVFLSVYAEDAEIPALAPTHVITTAPPTPNGPLHLGHMSGPYLAADVLARYLRLQGRHVFTHSGTDDHQTYVFERARRLGLEPEAFRAAMRARIEDGWAALGIGNDELVQPAHDLGYRTTVERFVARALQAGVLEERLVAFPYCSSCAVHLVDALITGRCPDCGETSSGGCEACGIVSPAHELLDPKCGRCNQPAEPRPARVHVFDLKRYAPLIEQDLARLPLTARLRDLCQRALTRPTLDVLASHPPTGHPAIGMPPTAPGAREADPLSGAREADANVVHVWLEMAAHYERFARSSATWTHCFGFDNAFHYLLYIPALLRALGPSAKLPDQVLSNEFLHLEGLKFSTSRNHAIWADEFAREARAAGRPESLDHLRLYLALNRPHRRTEDFSSAGFAAFGATLARQLEAIASASRSETSAAADASDGRVTRDVLDALIGANRLTRALEHALSPVAFDLRRAGRLVVDFIDASAHAAGEPGHRTRTCALIQALDVLMPREAARQRLALGRPSTHAWVSDWTGRA